MTALDPFKSTGKAYFLKIKLVNTARQSFSPSSMHNVTPKNGGFNFLPSG